MSGFLFCEILKRCSQLLIPVKHFSRKQQDSHFSNDCISKSELLSTASEDLIVQPPAEKEQQSNSEMHAEAGRFYQGLVPGSIPGDGDIAANIAVQEGQDGMGGRVIGPDGSMRSVRNPSELGLSAAKPPTAITVATFTTLLSNAHEKVGERGEERGESVSKLETTAPEVINVDAVSSVSTNMPAREAWKRLEDLEMCKKRGLLTDAEVAKKRQSILDDM